MSKAKRFEARVRLTKTIPPGETAVILGKYQLVALPPVPGIDSEALLRFENDFLLDETQNASNPQGECEIVATFLGLILNSQVAIVGSRYANSDLPARDDGSTHSDFTGHIDGTDYSSVLERLLRLEAPLAKQFLRACNAYTLALSARTTDTSLAFLLLVVAAECLSSQAAVVPADELHLDRDKCERFCRFINSYVSAGARGGVADSKLFTKLLKTIYYVHRSAFAHAGREVSVAANVADAGRQPYFKHYQKGKEVLTPGLNWFFSIVRHALLGFLDSYPLVKAESNRHLLGLLALENATLQVKSTRAIAAGELVTNNDIETL